MSEIIGRKDLAARIASEKGIPEKTVESVLRALGPVIAGFLEQDLEVRLPRFARFLVREHGGEEGPLRREVVAQISVLFREAVLGPSLPAVAALLGGEDGDVRTLLETLENDGLLLFRPLAGPHALEDAWKTAPFDVLVLGQGVAPAQYRFIAHDLKLHPDRTRVGVVQVVAEDADPFAVDTLTIIPDELIETPLDETVVAELFREWPSRGAEFLQQIAIRTPSTPGITEAAMELIESLGGLSPLGAKRLAEFVPAIREAVEQAVRTGNREDPGKYVDITFLVDDEKVSVVVKDEGAVAGGERETPDAIEDAGLSSIIMQKGADEVETLPPGNRVMLTKYY